MGSTASIVGGFSSLGGGIFGAQAAQKQGDFQKFISDVNAKYLDQQAADIEAKGVEESQQYQKKVKGMVGSQRAALAAQGIDVGSGSALDIQAETYDQGGLDALKIKNNAYREAFSTRMKAESTRLEGQFAQVGGAYQAGSTLLTGGLGAIGGAAEGISKMPKSQRPKFLR